MLTALKWAKRSRFFHHFKSKIFILLQVLSFQDKPVKNASGGGSNANIDWRVFRSQKKQYRESVKYKSFLWAWRMSEKVSARQRREARAKVRKVHFRSNWFWTPPQVPSHIISSTSHDCRCLPFNLKPMENTLYELSSLSKKKKHLLKLTRWNFNPKGFSHLSNSLELSCYIFIWGWKVMRF